jgi:hypothetical protein
MRQVMADRDKYANMVFIAPLPLLCVCVCVCVVVSALLLYGVIRLCADVRLRGVLRLCGESG